MATLVDTNVLLRLMQPHSPHSAIAERALTALRGRHETLHLAPQNLFEFWTVSTRPLSENGLGLTVDAASRELTGLKRLFSVLPELPLQAEWERLVISLRISGKNSHDARLIAAINIHGLDSILTFNTRDFEKYPRIRVIDPATVL